MFGSARTLPTKIEYQQAIEFGRKIAAEGWMIITGAGPGIMQAGHEGAELIMWLVARGANGRGLSRYGGPH